MGPIGVATIFLPATITTVTATAYNLSATVVIDGVATASAAPSAPRALKPGPNPIDVMVTAPDGKTQKHYTVVVAGIPSEYFKATNSRAGSNFGASVAISGDTLVVGASGDSSNAMGVNGNQADISAPSRTAAPRKVRSPIADPKVARFRRLERSA